MKTIKIVGLYIIAVVLFPWEWLKEQPSALRQAYWLTFATAHEWAREVRAGRR